MSKYLWNKDSRPSEAQMQLSERGSYMGLGDGGQDYLLSYNDNPHKIIVNRVEFSPPAIFLILLRLFDQI